MYYDANKEYNAVLKFSMLFIIFYIRVDSVCLDKTSARLLRKIIRKFLWERATIRIDAILLSLLLYAPPAASSFYYRQ